MQADSRGEKHRCFKCQTLFYDLKRPALVCPRCGADQADAAKFVPPKRARKAAAPKPAPKVEEPADEHELPDEDDDEEPADPDDD